MKTTELTGHALDWAVHVAMHGKCEGYPEHAYSTDWAQAGPIIERERICLRDTGEENDLMWEADDQRDPFFGNYRGATALIAAMRCYVASVLGAEVDVPEALL